MGTQATQKDDESEPITADNGREYPSSVYHEVSRAVYGSQQAVADAWARGALPTHHTNGSACTVESGSGNFTGYQYPDGHGVIKHYSTIEFYRTKHGVHLSNSECWSKGWAHCTTPSRSVVHERYTLPLTTIAIDYDLNAIEHVEQGDHPDYDRKVSVVRLDTGQHFLANRDAVLEELTEDEATDIMGNLR